MHGIAEEGHSALPEQGLAVGILFQRAGHDGGAAVMTGTLEKDSYSEPLFRQGRMSLLRYPVHLNHPQFERLKRENRFVRAIPYPSKALSAEREIQF